MHFAVLRHGDSPLRDAVADALVAEFLARGHEIGPATNGIQFVLNLTNSASPRAYRRRCQSVFVVTLLEAPSAAETLRADCYTALVRSLSNLLVCVVPPAAPGADRGPACEVYLTTPEAGFAHLPFDAAQVVASVLPIVGAHFATANEFSTDLPQHLWGRSPVVDSIAEHGRVLDDLGVLPMPFPLREVLPPRDLRHVYRIFGMTGMSYGNLSARDHVVGFADPAFWMTGRGVDKARISTVGKDVLLVKGLRRGSDPAIQVSVPPGFDPEARVSVDAVEHYLVYEAHPAVNAIVHVHAWMDGVPSTRQNHPCGTMELAEAVASLIGGTPDPSRAVVGLKNHGLTITGHSLPEIFDRIAGRLVTEVPMCS